MMVVVGMDLFPKMFLWEQIDHIPCSPTLIEIKSTDQRTARRSLRAFPITLTEESAIAAAAMTGERSQPIAG